MSETVYFGTAIRLPMLHCPNCGGQIEGATPVSLDPKDPKPKAGYMTICCYCASWLVFEESIASSTPLRVRIATCPEREDVLRTNPVATHVEKAARTFTGRQRRG